MCDKCINIKKIVKITNRKINETRKDKLCPVDVDMIKTIKAIAYEKILEEIQKGE